jgi:tetratricopeptide (TPR) repeat protein
LITLGAGLAWGIAIFRKGEMRPIKMAGLLVVAGLSVHAFFDFIFHIPAICILFAVSVGAALSSEGDAVRSAYRVSCKIAISCISAILLIGGVKNAEAEYLLEKSLHFSFDEIDNVLATVYLRESESHGGENPLLFRELLRRKMSEIIRGNKESSLNDLIARAIADGDALMARHPYDVDGICDRALLYLIQGKVDLAVAEFAKAAELAPENGDVLYQYAGALYEAGQYAQALEAYEHSGRAKAYRLKYWEEPLKSRLAELRRKLKATEN